MYKKSSDYQLVGFCDADYAGDRIERKSTNGNCKFLGENLISWASKRQATIALSIAEAEYISAASCCTQLLWMKEYISAAFVIIQQLSVCQRILFFIQEPSTLKK